MDTENLSAMSLLADMGNGEVQNAVQDLPRVSGSDDPISTPGRIVHWDAEWHWDATYGQYAHQALGGHVLALGLSNAHQIWEEYTGPIFDWAHQQNGIAGFAHMQYLDDGIPQTLNCCIPIEYPVEVALGASDFISEDVDGSDSAIAAYYRLLNTGFRPGLAAGTDHPCNGDEAPGSLLTYVQVSHGEMTYRNWIEGIAAGRTVVSRNGHNEFLQLTVNGTATPGDEIRSDGAGSVPVDILWTGDQSLSGTIELVQNGVVVASKQASVAVGSPASLAATVDFTQKRLARCTQDGQQRTSSADGCGVRDCRQRADPCESGRRAVLRGVDGQPADQDVAWGRVELVFPDESQRRASAVQRGEVDLSADRRRSRVGAGVGDDDFHDSGAEPVGVGLVRRARNRVLGGRDRADHAGARLHPCGRVRHARGADLARAGSGARRGSVLVEHHGGRRRMEARATFMLPTPLGVAANTDYVVAVSSSSDRYYAEQINGFAAPIVNGHLHTYVGSGVYTPSLGTMPTLVWRNTNYFRDVVFVPGP